MKNFIARIKALWEITETYETLRLAVLDMDARQKEINDYLGDISQLAKYVQEKDEKRDEVFALLQSARADIAKKTDDELADELLALDDLYLSVESGQAIGRQEIESKNYNLTKIETQRNVIRQQLAKD
jgi:hypothetical protein